MHKLSPMILWEFRLQHPTSVKYGCYYLSGFFRRRYVTLWSSYIFSEGPLLRLLHDMLTDAHGSSYLTPPLEIPT